MWLASMLFMVHYTQGVETMSHKVYHMAVNDVYPHYIAKAEKKEKTQCEVDELI